MDLNFIVSPEKPVLSGLEGRRTGGVTGLWPVAVVLLPKGMRNKTKRRALCKQWVTSDGFRQIEEGAPPHRRVLESI